jgi:hypothetical protein
MDKTKGILLSAFGRVGYIYAAFNMCASIKNFNKDVKVCLAFDRDIFKYLTPDKIALFDDLIEIPKEQFTTHRIDPAKYKTSIYKYLPYDETLILDVDGCALQDLEPLITRLSSIEGDVLTDVLGSGGKDDTITYSIWASNAYIWERFGLSDTSILPAIQSSFMYVKKGQIRDLFEKVELNYKEGVDKSKINLWGGTIPDELIFSATMAQCGINPKIDFSPIFFGNYFAQETFTELSEKFYILSLYGNGVGRKETKQRYIDYYDRIMRVYCSNLGISHDYKSGFIMQDKHLNFK